MPLLKYFRSLRGKNRRAMRSAVQGPGGTDNRIEPDGRCDELLAARSFYAEQETTSNLGDKDRRSRLRKHISGIFTI